MPKYADLHLHTTSKFFFHFDPKFQGVKPFPDRKFGKPALRSNLNRYHQADPKKLIDNNVQIAHLTLLAGERAGHQSNFWLFRAALFFITGLLPWQTRKFYKRYKTYFDMTQYESALIHEMNRSDKFEIVNDIDDLRSGTERTKILVSAEGIHCFIAEKKKSRLRAIPKAIIGSLNKNNTIKGFVANYEANYYSNENTYQENIRKNLRRPIPNPGRPVEEIKLFSIGASHFEYNYMLGQAWAVPIPIFLRKIDFLSALNVPMGKDGLSDQAKKLFYEINLKTEGHRILFDVKHASLKTRREYYELHDAFHKEHNLDNPIPIICSHTGVSGYKTFQDASQNNSQNGDWRRDSARRFNRWPINLCDNDITKIHDSGGLIGIMVDRRLLGHFQFKLFGMALQNCYYYKDILIKLKSRGIQREAGFGWDFYVHGVMFLDNVFHVVEVINDKKGWDTVCFGSDFDGNIKPIDCCPTYDYIQQFRSLHIDLLDSYYTGDDDKSHLYFGYTKDVILNKFFFENVKNFTERVVRDFW